MCPIQLHRKGQGTLAWFLPPQCMTHSNRVFWRQKWCKCPQSWKRWPQASRIFRNDTTKCDIIQLLSWLFIPWVDNFSYRMLTEKYQFLHQLMRAVPLLLLSSNLDIEEAAVNPLSCDGKLFLRCQNNLKFPLFRLSCGFLWRRHWSIRLVLHQLFSQSIIAWPQKRRSYIHPLPVLYREDAGSLCLLSLWRRCCMGLCRLSL